MNRTLLFNVVKIVLAVSLVVFILTRTTLEDVYSVFENISFTWLFTGVGCFFLICLSNGLRAWVLLERKVGFSRLFYLTCLVNGISNFWASGAGWFSYVAILRGGHSVGIDTGVSTLVYSKMGDIFATSIILGVASWRLWDQISMLRWVIIAILSSSVVVIIVFVSAVFLKKKAITLVKRILALFRLDGHPLGVKGLKFLDETARMKKTRFFLRRQRRWVFRFPWRCCPSPGRTRFPMRSICR